MQKGKPTNYFRKSLEAEVIAKRKVGKDDHVQTNSTAPILKADEIHPPEQIPEMHSVSVRRTTFTSITTLGSLADSLQRHGRNPFMMTFINEPLRPLRLTGWRALHFWNGLNQASYPLKKRGN